MTATLLALLLLSKPEPTGTLCSLTSPDFEATLNGAHRCRRRVTTSMRRVAFARYGIPWENRHLYELDHYYPLCLGGSNDLENLFPQPWDEAKKKDVVEHRLCRQLRQGQITQAEGISQMRAWRLSQTH